VLGTFATPATATTHFPSEERHFKLHPMHPRSSNAPGSERIACRRSNSCIVGGDRRRPRRYRCCPTSAACSTSTSISAGKQERNVIHLMTVRHVYVPHTALTPLRVKNLIRAGVEISCNCKSFVIYFFANNNARTALFYFYCLLPFKVEIGLERHKIWEEQMFFSQIFGNRYMLQYKSVETRVFYFPILFALCFSSSNRINNKLRC